MLKLSVFVVSTLLLAGPAIEARQPAPQAQRPATPQSIEDRTSGMKKIDGYFPLYWDERTGGMSCVSRLIGVTSRSENQRSDGLLRRTRIRTAFCQVERTEDHDSLRLVQASQPDGGRRD